MNLSKTIKRLTIKSYDSAIFFYNRARMYYYFYTSILKRQLVLGRRIEKILVVRLASIGDVVRATAVVKALKEKYPQATIYFLTTRTALPVLKNNPRLNRIYTLEDLYSLPTYDWVINLQRVAFPPNFLEGIDLTFEEILKHLSVNVSYELITGRHFRHGRDRSHVNLFHCRTELEELFFSALLPYSDERVADTEIAVDANNGGALERFGLVSEEKYLGIFLGSNSIGGDDNGQRSYSLEFVERLADHFSSDFTIVIVGQSNYKTPEERECYKAFLKRHPNIIDLVDKTTLEELVLVISALRLFICCDSGPLHIAMAVGTPVIGLYVNAASFRIAPQLRGQKYALINSFKVCFDFSWRWKFHCLACPEWHSNIYSCNLKSIDRKVDKIALQEIVTEAFNLLEKAQGSKCEFK